MGNSNDYSGVDIHRVLVLAEMTRRAAKKDANHVIIAQALEAAGCTVFDTSRVGDGFCDLIAVLPNGRVVFVTLFVEVKQPEGKFTAPEVKFALRFASDNYRVFTSPEQAAEAVRSTVT